MNLTETISKNTIQELSERQEILLESSGKVQDKERGGGRKRGHMMNTGFQRFILISAHSGTKE